MDFARDDDQDPLQQVLRTFFEAHAPGAFVRAQFDERATPICTASSWPTGSAFEA